ncbi:lipopolysaccharide transport periplasmic protein LptA [Alteromonas lipolytica]|uniref:Lipopolysaccharide export system protein LptA n=1 Tax=Alteromonas lipolytica TaxID=1856405 RepID=A0A1E8FCY2_9ALTE|nr:lipopolysaccharide transport periplasmic protein LptA [Alteromonas lipolytica]OFI33797.1 lipopolysaccharide transport periplasmic protein LptA [Alteromonas lipolytica]GGF68298.1 lipopolysaccharide export system protein LptA [Alteromonas lipolytica]
MYKRLIPLLTSLTLAVSPALVLAAKSDFKKDIEVFSESQFLDGKNKKSILIDNVQVTQGTLSIQADRVEVEAGGGKGKEVFIATGKPAVYSQTLDDGRVVEARAFEIRYEVANRTISLSGDAELNQNTSVVKGETIVYDMDKEQLKATGDGSGEGRVRTVFSFEDIESVREEAEENQDDQQDNDNE